jgi:hypothetical protein
VKSRNRRIVGVFWFLISILDFDIGLGLGKADRGGRRKYKIREVK